MEVGVVFSAERVSSGFIHPSLIDLEHFDHQLHQVFRHSHLLHAHFHGERREFRIAEFRFADRLAKDRGGFFHADVTLAEQLARGLAGEVQFHDGVSGVRADVLRVDLGKRQVGFQNAAHRAHRLNDFRLDEVVLHEVGRAEDQGIQFRQAVDFLLV